ncbi:UNVERIFIED_CONTAM: hypothetical protein FKN15_065273 [Acipenser sinensis]
MQGPQRPRSIPTQGPSDSPNCPWPPPSTHGAQRPCTGSHRLAKWSLAPPQRMQGPQRPRSIPTQGPSDSPNCPWPPPSTHGAQRPCTGSHRLAKWSLAPPQRMQGPQRPRSIPTQGPSDSPNCPWPPPSTHGAQRPCTGSHRLAKWSLAPPQRMQGPQRPRSIPTQGPSDSPNCPWPPPSTHGAQRPCTGSHRLAKWSLAPPQRMQGPQRPRSIPTQGPSDSPNCPWPPPSTHGAQRPCTGSHRLAKWSLAPPQRMQGPQRPRSIPTQGPSDSPNCPWPPPSTHGAQRPCTGSHRLAKWSLAPPQRMQGPQRPRSIPTQGPSDSPNCPWPPPSTHGAQRPCTGSHRLAKWSLAPPQRMQGPQRPRSIPTQGPSDSPNCPWPPPSTHGAQRPCTGSHRLAKWSLAPPQRMQGPQRPRSIPTQGPSDSPNCPWPPPSTHGAQRPCTGSHRLAKWSLAPPQRMQGPQRPRSIPTQGPSDSPNSRTGPSDRVRGLSGSPNGLWHLPNACTGTSDRVQCLSGSPIGPWLLPSARTGPSDLTQGPSGSPNGARHLPNKCSGPSDLEQGPSGLPNTPWHLPSTRTGHSIPTQGPIDSPNCPWHLPSTHGAQRPSAVSERLAKWSLAPPKRPHVRQRPRADSERLAKWSLAPPQHATRRSPSDPMRVPGSSPNGPWHLLSVHTATSDPTWDPIGSPNSPWHLPSMRMGPNDPAQGPSGSPNGPWHVPSMRRSPSDPMRVPGSSPNGPWHLFSAHTSDHTQAPSGLPNAPWHLPSAHTGPNNPKAGSQRLPKWFLAPPQCTHGH